MVVITNDTDSKSSLSSPIPSSSEAYSSMHNPPPPAYGPSSSQSNYGAIPPISPQSPQYYHSGPPTPQVYLLPVATPTPARPKRPAARRFCKAFFYAFLLYLLLAAIVKLLVLVFTGDIGPIQGEPSGPMPTDGKTALCYFEEPDFQTRSLPDFPYTLHNNYSLPLSSEYLYFISRGSYGSGSIRFELAKTEGNDIEVHTSIQARYKSAFSHIRVCSLSREDGGNGVGFFTPERHISYPDHLIRFDTIVKIPLPKGGRTDIKRLETRMRNWEHELRDLGGLVHFGEVDLDTTNARITVDSVFSASTALLQTKNGKISGNFNVSDHLLLKTSNARITGHINMLNKDASKSVKVDIKTTNGLIDTSVSLLSSATLSASTPSYSITASTSNSPLKFEVKDAVVSPSFPKLDLTAHTSNGRTLVSLHPTFEGSVFQETSNARKSLSVGENTVDPSGKGRRRSTLVKFNDRGKQQTIVWWGEQQQKSNMGTVRVETSNARNEVTVV